MTLAKHSVTQNIARSVLHARSVCDSCAFCL